MEITLASYMEAQNTTNILKIKQNLLQMKKRGVLFFKEDISTMDSQTSFHVYYHLLPNEKTECSAFPIPKQAFVLQSDRLDDKKTFEAAKRYFEDYYINEVLDKKGFDEFDLKNPFIGEDYVWLYKRTS